MAATRAEIAAMLHRFIEKYELVQGKAPGGLMGWIDPKRLQIIEKQSSSPLGVRANSPASLFGFIRQERRLLF